MKQALVIRHVPYEALAGFQAPIEAAGYMIEMADVTDPGFADRDLGAPDLLVLMGGPMGVYDRDGHPWIAGELARLARRIAAGGPTLGVCLGAQMVAAAMGAKVCPGPVKEVGFASVTLNEAGLASPLRHIADIPVLHWHGDTFDLPADVQLLASTPLYPHQAFRRSNHLLALQFHPEMGEDASFDIWLDRGERWLAEAGSDAATLRASQARHGARAVAAGQALLADWLARLQR